MARKLVKTVAREIRREDPDAIVTALYYPGNGWNSHSSVEELPEAEWGEYRANGVRRLEWTGGPARYIIDAS